MWYATDQTGNGASVPTGLAAGGDGSVTVTGQDARGNPCYVTYRIDSDGSYAWGNTYPSQFSGVSSSTAIALDQAGVAYVTGYSPGQNTGNDIVTIAYDTNGRQLWLQRYDGAAHLDDVGNAIAADNNGNVYVAGYETVAGGGTEMVLIKYAPVTVQKQTSGILLQAQGSPNEPFDIRATTNLTSWSDLATTNADANGLLQYLDTHAQLYPWRFYLAIPQ